MGRPKKSERGPVPTRDRILQHAMELFATTGYDAVSIKDITKPIGLTEASMYLYFRSKAALLDAIFERLEESLITPAFRSPPPDYFAGFDRIDVGDFLVEGARAFFESAGRETRMTWRILMINQFRYDSARTSVERHLLEAPNRFFGEILESMKRAGKIRSDIDTAGLGRNIGAIFFQYSFRENLRVAWGDAGAADSGNASTAGKPSIGTDPGAQEEFERLASDIRIAVRGIEP